MNLKQLSDHEAISLVFSVVTKAHNQMHTMVPRDENGMPVLESGTVGNLFEMLRGDLNRALDLIEELGPRLTTNGGATK
jgi:hypothetical protein